MEWIVPVLFVLATAAQWWLKRRHNSEEQTLPTSTDTAKSNPPVADAEPINDFGDLLEALGRRRHESPPATVPPRTSQQQATPPLLVLPPPPPAPIQPALTTNQVVMSKSPEGKQKSQPRNPRGRPLPHLRSRLREAVVMSEILAPPLALR